MNKQDLVDVVSAEAGTTKREAEAVINLTMAAIIKSVSSGEKVVLVGFGAFQSRRQSARTARNPRTNEPIHIPAKTKVIFKVGKEFAEKVARGKK